MEWGKDGGEEMGIGKAREGLTRGGGAWKGGEGSEGGKLGQVGKGGIE